MGLREDYEKRKKEREAEIASFSSSDWKNEYLRRTFDPTEFDRAYQEGTSAINKVNSGWQSSNDMDTYSKSIRDNYSTMKKITDKYGEAIPELNDYLKNYNSGASNLSNATKLYSKYLNADAYNKDKKKRELTEKYKGKSFDEIMEAHDKATDQDEKSFLANYTDFSSEADYKKAMRGETNGQRKKELADKLSNFQTMNAFDKYKEIMDRSDFAQFSDPTSIINAETENGLKNMGIAYNKDALKGIDSKILDRGVLSDLNGVPYLMNMSEEMQKVGAYIYNTQGADAYKEFIRNVGVQASAEMSGKQEKEWADWTNQNFGTGLLGSVANSLGRPLAYAGATIEAGAGAINSAITGTQYNPFQGLAGLNRIINASQAQLSESVEDKLGILGKIGYNAATEGITSRIGQMATGGLYNIVMGGGVLAQTYGDALLSGMSTKQALGKAVAAGLIETATEQIGMEKAFGWIPDKNWIVNVLKQSGAEASEEIVGNIANLIYDNWANGKNSEFQGDIQRYMTQGYTKEEAVKMAATKFALETLEEAATAGLSAGITGGVQVARTSSLGSNLDFEKLGEAVSTFSTDSKTKQAYDNLLGRYSESDKVPNWNKGAVFQQAMAENNEAVSKAMTDKSDINGQKSADAFMTRMALENAVTAKENNTTDEVAESNTQYIDRQAKTYKGIEGELFKNNYKGQDVVQYQTTFDYIKDYAENHLDAEQMLSHVSDSIMPKSKALEIYNKITENNATIRRAQTEANNKILEKWTGEYSKQGTFDDSTIDYKQLNKQQKQLAQTLSIFSKMGMNIKLINDESAKSINGSTDGRDIIINLSARYGSNIASADKGRYAVATFAHESTHWMENILGDEFETFKDLIRTNVGSKEWDDAINLEISRALQGGDKLTIKEAESEATARFCEQMLDDMSVADKIFSNASKSTLQKLTDAVKRWFAKIRNDLREWLKGYDPKSNEAQVLRRMDGVFESVQKAWTEMFERALAVNQLTEEQNKVLENANIEVIDDIAYNKKTLEETGLRAKGKKELERVGQILADRLDVPLEKGIKFAKDLNTIANIEANNKALEYEDTGLSAWVNNSEYGGNFDFSYLCPKRLVYTGTLNRIHELLKSPMDVEDFLAIRRFLIDKGYEAPCSFCYVEASRRHADTYIKEKFLDKPENKKYGLTIENLTNADFLENLRQEWLTTGKDNGYEAFTKAMNKLGQVKPKAVEKRRAYRGEILTQAKFKGKNAEENIKKVNKNGGLRFFAFSDFEIPHMLDTMQIIVDMSTKKLNGFAYTKQPAFVEVFGGTGLKIDMSCVAKGVDENGRIIFNDIEGINSSEAIRLRKKYSHDVGIVCVVFSDAQMKAALKDDRIDYVLPFHASGWRKDDWSMMGLPADTKDFTSEQKERFGNEETDTVEKNIPVSDFWDWTADGRQNAQNYLDLINARGMTPLFPSVLNHKGGIEILNKDGSHKAWEGGEWVLPKGKLGDGYFKLLIEQKMYDNQGNPAPQTYVKPNFYMTAARRLASEYDKPTNQFPVAEDVVDEYMDWRKNGRQRFSLKVNSDGGVLTEGQVKYFKNSQVRDDKGNLKVMYHGTRHGGFTVFEESDDTERLGYPTFFFTDKLSVAQSYSSVKWIENPDMPMTDEEVMATMEGYGEGWLQENEDGTFTYYEYAPAFGENAEENSEGYPVKTFNTTKEALQYYVDEMLSESAREHISQPTNYAVYINATNPLVIDAGRHIQGEVYEVVASYDGFGWYGFTYKTALGDFHEKAKRTEIDNYLKEVFGDRYTEAKEKIDKLKISSQDFMRRDLYNVISLNDVNIDRTFSQNWNDISFNGQKGSTRFWAQYAHDHGYDSVIINNVMDNGGYSDNDYEASTICITFESEQAKSIYNENPTKDKDIRYSKKVDSEGRNLSEGQEEYFADSKVRDENGNLLLVRHGTKDMFTIFNPKEKGGQNGTAEGFGIYFSDDPEVTNKYGDVQLEGYLNITHPAYDDKKTIKRADLIKLIKATTKAEAEKWEEDERDTWISNYENTYEYPLNVTYGKVADTILKLNGNDKDIIQEIMVGMGLRNYDQAYEFYDILKDTLGIDGFIVKWHHNDGESNVFVALDSNQFKNVDNINPTENPDIRFSQKVDETKIWKDTENHGGVRFGNFTRRLSPDERSQVARKIRKEVEWHKDNNERLDFSGYCLSDKHLVFYESYDDINSEIVGTVTFAEVKKYARRNGTWIDNNIGSVIRQDEHFTKERREDIISFARRIGVNGYDRIMQDRGDNGEGLGGISGNNEQKTEAYFSKKVKDDTIELLDQTARLKSDAEIFRRDINRLARLVNLQKKAQNGMLFSPKRLNIIADRLLKMDGVNYDKETLINNLNRAYAEITDSFSNETDMTVEEVRDTCLFLASKIVEPAKPVIETGDADTQMVVNEFSNMERINEVAREIYSNYWTVASMNLGEAVADKVQSMNEEHREAMSELRASRDKALAELRRQKNEVIDNLRKERDRKLEEYKLNRDWLEAERKQNAERNARIKKITDTATTLMEWLRKNDGKNGKSVPDALKPAVTQLLDAIDFSSKQLLGMRGGQYSGMSTRKDRAIAEALEAIRMFKLESDGDENYFDLPEYIVNEMKELSNALKSIVESSDGFVLQKMSLTELDRLSQIMTAVKTSITNINKRFNGRGDIDEVAIPDVIDNEELGVKQTNKYTKKIKKFFEWANTLPQYAFEHLGKGASEMFQELRDGWSRFAFNTKTIKDFAEATWTGKEYEEWSKHINKMDINVDGFTKHIEMTDTQIMSLYCLSKREQALKHMYDGGIRIASFDGKRGAEHNDPHNYKLTQATLEDIVGHLSERQIQVADAIQNFMTTTCSDWMNEVTMKRWGIKGATEENYFPITVDDTSLIDTGEPKDVPKSIFKLLNMGFTKVLNDKANNPLVVDDIIDVFTTHSTDMAKYNALALPILDMHRYYNFKQKDENGAVVYNMKKSMETAYGKDSLQYVTQFLLDLNANRENGAMDEFILGRGYKVAAVAGNLQVAALQPVAIVRSKMYLSDKNLLKGLAHIKSGVDEMLKYSGIAVWKDMNLFDTNIARGIDSQIKQNANVKDKFVEKTMAFAEAMDKITWGAIWSACKAEQIANGLKGDELIKATTQEFEDIIYHTQVVDSTMTRSAIMRDRSKAAQWITSFMSEPTISMNLLQDAGVRYSQDARRYGKGEALKRNGKHIAKCAYIYALNAAVEAVVRGLMGKYRDWDEESDEMLENMWKEFLLNILPLSNIPIGRDIVSILQGFDVDRMDMAAIEGAKNAASLLMKAINGERDLDYKTIYKSLQVISQATGIPLSSLLRDGTAIWNDTIGQAYPSLYIE